MSEVIQVHLASQVTIPAVAAVPASPGKPAVAAAPERVVKIPGMSNRVVRYRILNPDEVAKVTAEAATLAGEGASGRDFYLKQRMCLVQEMVVSYSVPTDDPMKLTDKDWKRSNPPDYLVPGAWSKVFTTKDTGFLQREYEKHHEMSAELVEILSGKALPVASEE